MTVTSLTGEPIRYIFRAWRRCPKTGDILYARDFGLRAWRIPIYEDKVAEVV